MISGGLLWLPQTDLWSLSLSLDPWSAWSLCYEETMRGSLLCMRERIRTCFKEDQAKCINGQEKETEDCPPEDCKSKSNVARALSSSFDSILAKAGSILNSPRGIISITSKLLKLLQNWGVFSSSLLWKYEIFRNIRERQASSLKYLFSFFLIPT